MALSIDEKSQIQVLDGMQLGLPLKLSKCPTMPQDYKRNETTTLFTALHILDGTVLAKLPASVPSAMERCGRLRQSGPIQPSRYFGRDADVRHTCVTLTY